MTPQKERVKQPSLVELQGRKLPHQKISQLPIVFEPLRNRHRLLGPYFALRIIVSNIVVNRAIEG